MLNFPLPYTDELIYSVVARAGAHMGIASPKQLLDTIFGSRSVIATVDLPNHLDRLHSLYPSGLRYSVEQLAYEHTLFPIFAPFTVESRRKQCLKKMVANSQGAIHLMLGIAASRLKQSKYLRYCPLCLERQLTEHGEYYWQRQWQIVGADCCLEHGQLIEAYINRHDYHRHQFFTASPSNCPASPQKPADPWAIKVALQIDRLLNLRSNSVVNFVQWSTYYQQLAGIGGCLVGRHVRHEAVQERVRERWSMPWLNARGLVISDAESSWLHSIFRKHRKSFSYLEHIVALDSLLPGSWRIDDVLAEVLSIRTSPCMPVTHMPIPGEDITEQRAEKRAQWLALISRMNVKQVRSGNGALYAWLYRHDRAWFLSANRQFYLPAAKPNRRVDWRKRDLVFCRNLIKIRNASKSLLDSPRLSKNWYLSKLDKSVTVEKNIRKMPLTALFFQRYCEDISDYQIRRLIWAAGCFESEDIQRWRLLKVAGLSDERLTDSARGLLQEMMEG